MSRLVRAGAKHPMEILGIAPDVVIPVSGDLEVTAGAKSTLNNTNALLSGGATFTGGSETNDLADMACFVTSDQEGTLFFEFQDENGVWQADPESGVLLAADEVHTHITVKLSHPARVRYVNGSAAQGMFSLSTFFGSFRLKTSPLNTIIEENADTTIVRAINSDIDLAVGRIGGQSEDVEFGAVKAIDGADVPVDVWRMADDTFANRSASKTFISAAVTLYISSDSGSDTDVDILIKYLDTNGEQQNATVNLNGQTAVATVTALDVSRLSVANENINVGNIYINTANAHTGGVPDDITTVLAFIPVGKGQSQQALETAPAGFIYHIKRILIYLSRASGAAGSAEVELQVQAPGGSFITVRDFPMTTNSPVVKDEAGLVFVALTRIRMRVTDVSDADTNITAEWDFDLVSV